MRKRIRRVAVPAALALSLVGLSGTASGSEDPWNGSWTGIYQPTGIEVRWEIGGANHHAVGSSFGSFTCENFGLPFDSRAFIEGFGEIHDHDPNHMTITGYFACISPGEGREVILDTVNVLLLNNGDGTLTVPGPLDSCLHPSGHPEACEGFTP